VFRYVQTWERNAKSGCHVNVIVNNQAVWDKVNANWRLFRRAWLAPNAKECCFGNVTYVQNISDNISRLSGYLVKLSNELTGCTKKHQVPFDAPAHFRRIRASAKTLPVKVPGELTGRLVMSPISAWTPRALEPGEIEDWIAEDGEILYS
jgi:hypothetical protein